ncbi:MAG TPA: 2-hydroxychromene-2-carboxylate isomerase [Myxococcota bacterium]|nr:2-hydroxychromene-2-carboxylate isomerase [Myxococcota bacterium]
MRTLRFSFDYISSNAYLAWVRLPELRQRFGLRIEPIPVLFAGLLEANGQLGPAEIRPKARWMARNNLRKASLLGIQLRPPAFHPFKPLLPLRVSSLDLADEARETLISALFRATWSEGLHVSEPEVVARVANGVGLDGETLLEQASSPPIKDRLRAQTDAAIARGVFGVPTFEVEDELFWGYDDLPYLERFLAGEDTLDPEEARLWGGDPPRPSSMRRQFRDEAPPSWQRETKGR